MRIRIPGSLKENRSFISEELPSIVYQTNMDSKVGGRAIRTVLKLDRLQNWKVLADTPKRFSALVFLPKTSKKYVLGRPQILIQAHQEASTNSCVVNLTEDKSIGLVVFFTLLGLAFCVIPGLLVLIANGLHSNFHRKVMSKVGSLVKERFPEAELYDL